MKAGIQIYFILNLSAPAEISNDPQEKKMVRRLNHTESKDKTIHSHILQTQVAWRNKFWQHPNDPVMRAEPKSERRRNYACLVFL